MIHSKVVPLRRLLCLLVCLLTATLVAADEPQGNDNQSNDKWVEPARSRLMHVIGGMPFFPHRANTTGNLVLNVKDFDNAQCLWRLSYGDLQAVALVDDVPGLDEPIYRALLKRASAATEGKVDNFCTGCHTPDRSHDRADHFASQPLLD